MRLFRSLLALGAALVAWVLALPAALLVLPFILVRRLTQAVVGGLRPEAVEANFIEYDPGVGWMPKANLNTHATDLNEDLFHFTTDAEGWRGRRSIQECQVVAFGDSFAFGYAVGEKEFFGELDAGFPVKAVGAPGYNMVQCLLWMRKLAPQLRGKSVIWLVYLGNDLEDNLKPSMMEYRTPFVRNSATGGWEMVTSHLSEEPWPFPTRRRNFENYVEICRPTHLSRRVFSACEHLIREARDVCESVGARLVVMTVPDFSPLVLRQFQDALASSSRPEEVDLRLPDRRIREMCEHLGLPFVSLADHLDGGDYRRHDVHWNEQGHRKVLEIIKRACRDVPREVGPTGPPVAPRPPAAVAGR